MNAKHWHLLKHYQHLMPVPYQLCARWLVEDWDRQSNEFPKWLTSRVFQRYHIHEPSSPEQLARKICLNLLSNHRASIHLPNELKTKKPTAIQS